MKKIITSLFLFLLLLNVEAQTEVQMADVMKSNGKIYVVIAVMLTILIGITLYLIRIDRKISKLENNK